MIGLRQNGMFSRISSFIWASLDLIFVLITLSVYALLYILSVFIRSILFILDFFKRPFSRSAASSSTAC